MGSAVFLAQLASRGDAVAFAGASGATTFRQLVGDAERQSAALALANVPLGAVCALEAGFGGDPLAMALALMRRQAVIAPLLAAPPGQNDKLLAIGEVEFVVRCAGGESQISATGVKATHELYKDLRKESLAGFLFFSSGTSGVPKAILHDAERMLRKFLVPRPARKTLAFLGFDHMGGWNTILHVLANGGTVVVPDDRAPDVVLAAVDQWQVEVLPTTPTFLNLAIVSGALDRADLGSLKLLTYGTEPMPATTLVRLRERLPKVDLLQTYGLSEIGVLRSRSKEPDSLWMRIGGEGVDLRVVNGLLEIRTAGAMRGYLNAASPFTADGWFRTGDAVEVDGEYYRVLGRRSELIIVGGEKVWPIEIEAELLRVEGVLDAVVSGAPSPLTGQLVTARVRLADGLELAVARARIRKELTTRLAPFKVPQKIELLTGATHTDRFKKVRSG